jgi:putative flavoprotein involved in K+ transport
MSTEEIFNTIVIGGGQAGLAAGYYLAQQGQNFVILDGEQKLGQVWRRRWDSLRMFTPVKFNALPGLPFPGDDFYFPTKDEAADYLERYADKLQLPVRPNTKIEKLEREGESYRLSAGEHSFKAEAVIVATGSYQAPYIPAFAAELDPAICQLHTYDYRSPGQIPAGRVLVVGAGNSGADIGLELRKAGREVWLSGRDVGHIPANQLGKYFGGRPFWWFINHVMTIKTPLGRKMRQRTLHHGDPLIRYNRKDILQVGIQPAPRLAGVQAGKARLQDGRILDIQAVVWATGFRPDYQWIGLPVFDQYGFPRHQRGVVPEAQGLYFLGLPFQSGPTSSQMGGVGRDAEFITRFMSRS